VSRFQGNADSPSHSDLRPAGQHPLRAQVLVVAPGAQPLPRAENEYEIVRRPAAAIVLRWLLFAADSVADGSHLAIMSVQVTRPRS
jgi:hypothetical protein